ncbi:MAG: hypothetical protein V3T62_04930 [Alphaproteobacteria bacterium]
MRADIDEHVAGLEMGVEKSAGGVFETAMTAFTLDQMLDRDILEKVFRDRQGKSRLTRSLAKNRGQKESAVGRRLQANGNFPGVAARGGWGWRWRNGGRRRSSPYEPLLENLS